jgi:hypothetical protein
MSGRAARRSSLDRLCVCGRQQRGVVNELPLLLTRVREVAQSDANAERRCFWVVQ